MSNTFTRIILFFFITSCGIKKPIKTNEFSPKKSKELIKLVETKHNDYDFISLKANVKIKNADQEINFKTNIKNQKDSIIWISANAFLGVEIFRAQITPDTIYIINRLKKTYSKKAYSEIKSIIDFDFSFDEIQDIIMGIIRINEEKCDFKKEQEKYHLYSANYQYFINKEYRTYKKVFKNKNAEIYFDKYNLSDKFPRIVKLKTGSINATEIEVNYTKVKFNQLEKILFTIPKNYNEIN